VAQDDFVENLSGIIEPALSALSDALSTVLNRKIELSLGEICPSDIEELKTNFPEELVVIQSAFTEGISDEIDFLLQKKLAAVLADLMMMGEGDQEFSEEEHLDGIGELFNQVGGVLSTYLSDLSGSSVKLGPATAILNTIDANAEKWAQFIRVDLQINVEGFDPGIITLQIAPQTVSDLQDMKRKEDAPMEDRPPQTVLDDDEESFMQSMNGSDHETEVRPASFDDFGPSGGGDGTTQNIEALMDLDLPVIIELGRTTMFIRDILELGPGSIVELNKLSGEPVDLYINEKRFARGEVVVIDESFGIRITDLVKIEDRIRSLR